MTEKITKEYLENLGKWADEKLRTLPTDRILAIVQHGSEWLKPENVAEAARVGIDIKEDRRFQPKMELRRRFLPNRKERRAHRK